MTPKFLYWRKKSLYCRYPLPGYPKCYPLKIYTTGTPTDRRRCERLGEEALAALRTKAREGKLFDKKVERKAPKEYNPKFWRLVARYWYHHLQFSKSASTERFHLKKCLNKFGLKYAKEITGSNIELWINEMKKNGDSVNVINNRYAYLQAAYKHCSRESDLRLRINYDPTLGLNKLKGGKIRTFVLTEAKFERNYNYFLKESPRFANYYLALFETGRRPKEVSFYTWEMIQELVIDGRPCRAFYVPPDIAKTDEPDMVPISDRLWRTMSQQAWRTGYVFRNSKGGRWYRYQKHQSKLRKKFGIDAGWIRDTRRGFITHKTEVEGCDPEHVRAISGHKSPEVFKRYRIGKLKNLMSVVNPEVIGNRLKAVS